MTDPLLAERMLTAMLLEYVRMVREDPLLDRDAELTAAIGRYLG